MKRKTKQVRERWRIFVGSPKYEVSNTGKIRNRKTKHILNCRCDEVLAFGKEDLLVRLGYVYDKIYLKYSLEEVVKSANIPNISVTRLNKPIP